MHGDPFSTTSQRTLRARQQQQALDARRFTGRELAGRPAVEALRLLLGSVSMGVLDADDGDAAELVIVMKKHGLGWVQSIRW